MAGGGRFERPISICSSDSPSLRAALSDGSDPSAASWLRLPPVKWSLYLEFNQHRNVVELNHGQSHDFQRTGVHCFYRQKLVDSAGVEPASNAQKP